MNWKKFLALILIILIITSILGCENKTQEKKPPAKIKLGVSMATMAEDVYTIMKKAMYDNKDKDKVEIIWKNANNDEEKTG